MLDTPPRKPYVWFITAAGGVLVSVSAFIVASALMLWVLWEFVYGDNRAV